MTKNKDEQIRKKGRINFTNAYMTLLLLLFLLLILVTFMGIYSKNNLEQELSECQDKVLYCDNESLEGDVFKPIPINWTKNWTKPSWMGYSEDEIPKEYLKLIVYEKSCWTDGSNCVYYEREVYFPKNYEAIE